MVIMGLTHKFCSEKHRLLAKATVREVKEAPLVSKHLTSFRLRFSHLTQVGCALKKISKLVLGELERPISCPTFMNYDVTSDSQFGSWGSEVTQEQMQIIMSTWHELRWVRMSQIYWRNSDVTTTSYDSLPGQAQNMPPQCLHMSTLLCSVLVDNSVGVTTQMNLWEARLNTSTRNVQC